MAGDQIPCHELFSDSCGDEDSEESGGDAGFFGGFFSFPSYISGVHHFG